MSRRMTDVAAMGLSVGIIALSAVAIAQPWPGNPTPGWEWGRLNCGPHTSPVRSLAECNQCCQAQYDTGWETQTWLAHCQAYCASVTWGNW